MKQVDTTALRTIVIAALFAACASIFIGHLAALMPAQLTDVRLCDTYFGSDIPRRYECLVNRFSGAGDAYKHPLFPLLYFPLRLARLLLGCDCRGSVIAAHAANGIFWAFLCWTILFQITHRVLDATMYSLLALSTASSILWLPVAETYAFGGTSVLIPLYVLSIARLRTNLLLHSVAFVTSAAITITNAMAAFVSAACSLKPLKMLCVLVLGGTLLFGFSLLQKWMCPPSMLLLSPEAVKRDYRLFAQSKPIGVYTKNFLLEPLIPSEVVVGTIPRHLLRMENNWWWPANRLPAIDISCRFSPPVIYKQLFHPHQGIAITSHSLWLGLLLVGAVSPIIAGHSNPVNPAIRILIGGQWVLHYIYGHETLIYSAHWMPMLVFIAASSSTTVLRPYTLAATLLLIPLIFLNNVALFHSIVRYVSNIDLDAL